MLTQCDSMGRRFRLGHGHSALFGRPRASQRKAMCRRAREPRFSYDSPDFIRGLSRLTAHTGAPELEIRFRRWRVSSLSISAQHD